MELGLNKNKSEVTYFNDIVSELSENFNMDNREVNEICQSSLDYIVQLSKVKDTLAIRIPFLGVLYFSKSLGNSYKNAYSSRPDLYTTELENLEYRLEQASLPKNKRLKKKPFLYTFKNIIKKMGYKTPKGGTTKNPKGLWTTVSLIQNNING